MSAEEESLLTDLCAICHINPPKYRCPRCSTRTCSLPCTRRHKLWSQCSGIRDPAAYLRRNELATEAAFDRDFNFITGIERRLERAERDAENRGVDVSAAVGYGDLAVLGLEHEHVDGGVGALERERKRKRGQGEGGSYGGGQQQYLVKGEAAFLRRAENAGVKVIRAPRGMSRGKANGSKWHQRNKCLYWTIEWITGDGEKETRNCAETCSIAEAYDRAHPLLKEEKETKSAEIAETQTGEDEDKVPGTVQALQQGVGADTVDPSTPDIPEGAPSSAAEDIPNKGTVEEKSHRGVYFYLHRPRTATKQPVLVPLMPNMKLTSALRGRAVMEFPTIYVLQEEVNENSDQEKSRFILETEYLRTHDSTDPDIDEDTTGGTDSQPLLGTVDISNVDESKVLEVLKKDLLNTVPGTGMTE